MSSKILKVLDYLNLTNYTSGTKVLKLVLTINIVALFIGYGYMIYFYFLNVIMGWRVNYIRDDQKFRIKIETWIEIVITIIHHPTAVYLMWKSIHSGQRKYLKFYLIATTINFIIFISFHIDLKYFRIGVFSETTDLTFLHYLNYYINVFLTCVMIALRIYESTHVYICYKKLGSPLLLQLHDHSAFLKDNGQECEVFEKKPDIQTARKKSIEIPMFQPETDVSHKQFEDHIINPLDILIDFDNALGEGNFGTVYSGNWFCTKEKIKIACACKVVKGPQTSETFGMLLQEMKIMIRAMSHENVVKFYGVTTDASSEFEHFTIISELCEAGSLDDFLVNNRHTFMNLMRHSGIKFHPEEPLEYINLNEHGTYSSADLVRFSIEIARGMEHLASKHIVHGDLACRNIILTKDLKIKLTDFGLSRRLYNYQLYSKIDNTKECFLPWRSMSLEAIEDLKFSEKSDVWSYGVLLWEIFSLGELPYKNLEWSADIPLQIRNGLQLQRPRYATAAIYRVMQMCWRIESARRPDFFHLRKTFEKIGAQFMVDFSNNTVDYNIF